MKSTVGYLFLVIALSTVLSKNQVSAEMDPAGNILASPEATTLTLSIIGDVINSFPNPSALRGLTFKDGRLWGITSAGFGGTGPGVLYEMNADTGAIISTLTLSPMPPLSFGLGFDASRNVFIVTDPSDDTILKVDPNTGVVLGVHTTFVQKMALTYYTHNCSLIQGHLARSSYLSGEITVSALG